MNATALIIALQMDARAAAHFTKLRQAYFPPDRNWLAAHITLFYALPITAEDRVLCDAADLAIRTEAFEMDVDRVLFLGRGVAYAISSTQGIGLRSLLAARWDGLLGRQDRAWHGPLHVTVQNKVQPLTAKKLHAELERNFMPHPIRATGLQVWHYVGGPWQHVATFPFVESTAHRCI